VQGFVNSNWELKKELGKWVSDDFKSKAHYFNADTPKSIEFMYDEYSGVEEQLKEK